MSQGRFVYVDDNTVGKLARALEVAAEGAEKLGGQVDESVSAAVDLGVPTLAEVYSGVPGWDPVGPGGKLTGVGREGPETAAEIRRRLEFLAACERLEAEGLFVDPSLCFEDGEPPKREDIEELASMFREFGPDVALDRLEESEYSSAEIDAAIASLSDEELRAMNEMLALPPEWRPGSVHGFLLAATPTETSSWLFANVSAAQMERLNQQVPELEPPDPADVEELASMFREHGPDVVFANEDVSQYTAAEIDAAIASLSDEELRAMNLRLSSLARNDDALSLRVEISSWLFANVSAAQMERLHLQVPMLEPTRPDDHGTGWQTATFGLENEDFSYQDVDQGELGTCWFLASVGATAVSNSDFLRDNIQQNPNGSYTVTLYVDGRPVEVTVSNYLPDPPYAAGPTREPNWVAIYEKAAAQLYSNGSYEELEGGYPSGGLELVTGGGHNLDVRQPSLDELEQRLDAGQPVVVGTQALPWDEAENIVEYHAYMVVDVTVNADGERVVHLRNPWGNTDVDRATDLYLTESEYHKYFELLYEVPAPG